MIGRSRITINFRRDGVPISRVVYGIVTTEHLDGKLEPFASSLVFQNFYRLIIPRSLDLHPAQNVTVSFGERTNVRLETPITPVYDAHGRIRHYEAVVKSN